MVVNRKWTLQGVFDRINSYKGFPVTPEPFVIYFRINDLVIQNGSKIVVEIRRSVLEDMEGQTQSVFRGALDFNISGGGREKIGPTTFDFGMPVKGVTFTDPGVYDVLFLVENALIDVWTLNVVHAQR